MRESRVWTGFPPTRGWHRRIFWWWKSGGSKEFCYLATTVFIFSLVITLLTTVYHTFKTLLDTIPNYQLFVAVISLFISVWLLNTPNCYLTVYQPKFDQLLAVIVSYNWLFHAVIYAVYQHRTSHCYFTVQQWQILTFSIDFKRYVHEPSMNCYLTDKQLSFSPLSVLLFILLSSIITIHQKPLFLCSPLLTITYL